MKSKILGYQSLNTDFASLLLRLIFGGLFIYHGYTKLIAFDDILKIWQSVIGLSPKLELCLVIFAEFFCGILVTLGLFTRLAVIPIFITMIVVFFVAQKKDAFPVKELSFTFLLLSIVIYVLGSGKFSLDRLIFKRSI